MTEIGNKIDALKVDETKDSVLLITELSMTLIPYVGGFFAGALGQWQAKKQKQRVIECLNSLENEIKSLPNAIFEGDDFKEATIQIVLKVAKERKQEKRKYFANIYKKYMQNENIEHDEENLDTLEKFSQIIDDLSIDAFTLLLHLPKKGKSFDRYVHQQIEKDHNIKIKEGASALTQLLNHNLIWPLPLNISSKTDDHGTLYHTQYCAGAPAAEFMEWIKLT